MAAGLINETPPAGRRASYEVLWIAEVLVALLLPVDFAAFELVEVTTLVVSMAVLCFLDASFRSRT